MQMGGHAHGGMGAAMPSHGAQHSAGSSHASHAGAGAAGSHGSQVVLREPTPPPTHDCTCLGECCTVAPATLPSPNLQVALGIEIAREATPSAPAREIRPSAQLSHVLPFANGPPSAA